VGKNERNILHFCILYFKYMIESILYFKYIPSTVFVFCISSTLQAMYLYFVFQI